MKETIKIDKDVSIDCYSLGGNCQRPTVIICPGGGYGYHSVREGEPVAYKFLSYGFNSIVLHYRVAEKAKFPNPMVDLEKVVELGKKYAGNIFRTKKSLIYLSLSLLFADILRSPLIWMTWIRLMRVLQMMYFTSKTPIT